jgi:hypothetical protein
MTPRTYWALWVLFWLAAFGLARLWLVLPIVRELRTIRRLLE